MGIPNIDFYAKLITFLGIGIISFAIIDDRLHKEKFETQSDIVALAQIKINGVYSNIEANSKTFNTDFKYKVDSINQLDKQLQEKKIPNSEYLELYKSLVYRMEQMSLKYQSDDKIENDKVNKLKIELALNEDIKSYLHEKSYDFKSVFMYSSFIIIGGFFVIAGVMLWGEKENEESKIKIRENLNLPTYSKCCQSCGKNFNSIVKYSKDGDTKNYHFCDSCYKDGSFIEPDLTLVELKTRVTSELNKLSLSPRKIKSVNSKIEKLERWKTNLY